ncbi:ferritin-like domain-containing protein [Desulfovibrio inopinatus]|uniref:ferritin-like domain-containing protein n=1 Tax=Desulfovibrio inopinatus TaxID=102109 RepID=UPI0004816E12|nr:ferritin family protein [Desulfovibrio inopinatus]
MASFFHANEIAKFAVEIERRGQEFYRQAALNAQEPDARNFFEYFAGEETKHEQLFQQLFDRLGKIELPAWSTSNEYVEYLNALIDSHQIFTPGLAQRLAEKAKDKNEAIRMAMAFEKDTILFFMEMRELVPEAEKAFIAEIIEEERGHLKKLRGALSK